MFFCFNIKKNIAGRYITIPLLLFLINLSCHDNPVEEPENLTPDQEVEALISQMTLDEKIGQMTQAERGELSSITDIRDYYLGSLLSGGGSAPSSNTPAGWADMYDQYQSIALQTRLKIPLIYGIDAVHGHNNVRGAVIFPHNIGLGCTRNPSLIESAARITAKEVAGTGIDWTFAPCIAVARDERWGRTYEGFGETPELAVMAANSAVKGYQGTDLSDPASILACAKHYAGDGGTTDGKDQGETQLDEFTLRRLHIQGYISAIKAGVGSVMVSYSSWNGQKLHGHKYLITDVLKTELGFSGFVVSDYNGIDQLPGNYKSDIETAINAGIDMVMVPGKYKEFIAGLKALVNEGKVPLSRIDDAVRRILRIKMKMGLFQNSYTNRTLTASIGSQQHRDIARECVRQSLVLLKNSNNTLPLKKTINKLLVSGRFADDIGAQCGGWTISWQGSTGNITTGTTILQAITKTVSENTTITYSQDGIGASGYDAAVVVIGEAPYAEFSGDRTNLALSNDDLTTITRIKNAGVPVIVILLSGRPMIINDVLNNCNAFIAAWLPGTEGQGIADVLFGDFKPVGKLSHSWPEMMSQIPVNSGDENYTPLFEYGYGLSYE